MTDAQWEIVGFIGQFVFGGRFLAQWIASEQAKKGVVPISFWYLSILGAIIVFGYAVHKSSPSFMMSQAFGLVVYCRNLALVAKHKEAHSAQPE
ncbi:MAG: lipid-A-disaccharide synthase N-terminal domain-containing protein [Candidatus Wallbacteria bacterium]|nr:lipid-A-disaccharide synthase N-terminal domain-containing protein [Candidatus Wallbacteria bacterium]